jgi:apolipoprotein N-acyltransferase
MIDAPAPKESTARNGRGQALPAVGRLPLAAPQAFAAAALSGVLYWLAFPTADVWPLALIAWAPLVVAMHRQTPARAAQLGATAGLVMNVAGHIWLQSMLRTFSGFSAPLCFFFVVVVCGYQGGRIAFLGWLYGRAAARGWPAALVFAGAFVASELLYPVLFPWYFSATVHDLPLLCQLGDIGGPILVGLVLVAINLSVAEIALALAERRSIHRATVAFGVIALAAAGAYGALRIRSIDAAAQAAPMATVGVVQANMGLMEKRTLFEEGLRRHLDLSHALREKADFLVWSETSAMRPVLEDSYREQIRGGVAQRIGLPAIFGAVTVKFVDDARQYVLHNSAVASDASGRVTSRYDKEYLLAFGEFLPFGDQFPILYKWSPNSGRFTPGTSLDPLLLDVAGKEHPVTALICYEDILPRFTNAAVRKADPELIVNITNDAWFGDTAEPWEHLALSQLRAVEHHRYFVRGTNSGVSAVIDPVGRVIAHGGTFRQESFTAPIHWMRSRTIYETLGDWPWALVSCAAIAAAFVRRRGPTLA